MERGECVEEAARREVWEETGIDAEVTTPYSIFSVPPTNELYIIYRANVLAWNDPPVTRPRPLTGLPPSRFPGS